MIPSVLLAGVGSLLILILPILALVFFCLAAIPLFLWSRSIVLVCPHCGVKIYTILSKKPRIDIPCTACRGTIHFDTISKMPVFISAEDSADQSQEMACSQAPEIDSRAINVEQGHPMVRMTTAGNSVTYRVRSASFLARQLLIVAAIGIALVGIPSVIIVKAPVFPVLGIAAIFLLLSLAFLLPSHSVSLTPGHFTMRWQVLPFVGRTYTLPVGEKVVVRLAHRGSSMNEQPVSSVVITSQGREISFGSFLPDSVKKFLGTAIHDYYTSRNDTEPKSQNHAVPTRRCS